MYAIRNPVAAGVSNLETQIGIAMSLANKTLDSVNRLTDLNVNLARATLEHSNFLTRQLMSAEDRRELYSVMSAQSQPNARRTFDYAYYLTTIFTCAQMDFFTILGEGIADTSRKVVSLVKDVGPDYFRPSRTRIAFSCDSWPGRSADVTVNERRGSHGGGTTSLQ
ncbi:MAG: phasin family protein [Burkholderia sp.]|nr:phasin family protein [Burkholderia sp.]